jgi:hypothetical protein
MRAARYGLRSWRFSTSQKSSDRGAPREIAVGTARARETGAMTSTFPVATRIHVLLHSLVGERHVRGPLLNELIDALHARPELADVEREAVDLADALGAGLGCADFDSRVRHMIDTLPRVPGYPGRG